jgi:hypothetical protein
VTTIQPRERQLILAVRFNARSVSEAVSRRVSDEKLRPFFPGVQMPG